MRVVVVGAGVAGLAIGWRLAQQGVETLVLERSQPGRGATWASAGMIAAPGLASAVPDSEAQLANHGAELWPEFAAQIERASRRAVSYSVDGGLIVARTPQERDDLARMAKNGAGELLSPEAARAREPRLAPDMLAALWNPCQAKVDNRALGRALAAAFAKAGGHLFLNEAVVRFEFRGDRIEGARTPFALRQADAYVLAAGAWSARIEGLASNALPPVVPVKGEMIALEPSPGEELPQPAIGGSEIYLVAQRERLLIGATVERAGFDSSLTDKASSWLLARGRSLMPCLEKWKIAEHWAGLRPGSPDDLPIIGQSALPGLFVASGQYRNGILYAPAVAQAVSAMVMGNDAPPYFSAFDPRRFDENAPSTEYSE
jgi:glycine oxidase